MPDPLPWSEVLRRRNGLPPAELDDAAELRSLGLDRSAQPLDTEPEPDPDLSLLTISPGTLRAYLGSAQSPEPRCDLFDLPTTMCHHCKET